MTVKFRKTRKIILASASPRRKKLLRTSGIMFTSIPNEKREKLPSFFKHAPQKIAINLALEKAKDVLHRIKHQNNLKNSIIIGADTIIVLGKKILGKPKNEKDAFRTISLLSGRKHFVFTGLALIDTFSQKTIVGHEKSTVWFKELSPLMIYEYIDTSEPFDKAGAYAFQGKGRKLISKYSGPEDNIIGLPLKKLKKMLEII